MAAPTTCHGTTLEPLGNTDNGNSTSTASPNSILPTGVQKVVSVPVFVKTLLHNLCISYHHHLPKQYPCHQEHILEMLVSMDAYHDENLLRVFFQGLSD